MNERMTRTRHRAQRYIPVVSALGGRKTERSLGLSGQAVSTLRELEVLDLLELELQILVNYPVCTLRAKQVLCKSKCS